VQLNILPFEKLVSYAQGILTHSIVYKLGPPASDGHWTFNADRNPDLELRNGHDIYIPLAVSEQVKRLPLFSFAENWNKLPYDRLNPNHTTFKIALLNHLKSS
jgi:hypothetical protein